MFFLFGLAHFLKCLVRTLDHFVHSAVKWLQQPKVVSDNLSPVTLSDFRLCVPHGSVVLGDQKRSFLNPGWNHFRTSLTCFCVAMWAVSFFKQWHQNSITYSIPHVPHSHKQSEVCLVFFYDALWQYYSITDWSSISTTSFSVVLHPVVRMKIFS